MDIFSTEFESRYATSANAARESQVGKGSPSIDALRREVDRQRLVIEVLVRALIDKGLYTRDQLNALANLVDMEDGIRDGRMQAKGGIELCSSCGRTLMNKLGTCLYCGNQEVIDIV